MENIKKLYIETHKEDIEPEDIRFENLGYFYDIKNRICIHKKYIEYDLKVGFVYDFTYEDYNDTDIYSYVVLKKEGNIYYIAEYYNKFIQCEEKYLADAWVKCDVKEELGINIKEWKTTKIYDAQTPDMREKVKEYISELDTEIDRCHKEISNLSYDEVQARVNRAEINVYMSRANTLTEVKNDLQSKLDELI